MFFYFYFFFSQCFEPKCTSSFSGDLWSSLNNFNCDGDALLTINSQTITLDRWCDIGSWNKHVTGTLKIQGVGKVVVEGGFKINGWTSDTQNPNILKTTVEQTIHGSNSASENHVTKWAFESLWVNDHRATRARVPSGWTLPTIKSVSTSGSGDFITYTVGVPSSTMKFLQNLSNEELKNVNIVVFHYWSTTRAYIDSINTNANTITFTAHKVGDNNKGIEPGKAYFYLENLKTALTKPGEWFLSTTGELFYYPLPGETANNIEVYASHDKRLMYIGASNVILENIEFRHCGGNIPNTGVTREDNLPSSPTLNMKCVDVYQSTNVQFIKCSFRHVFCRALSLFECTSCVVEECLIEDFGADGIAIGDSSNTRIYNNIIRHGGRLIHHENAFYDNLDPGAVISHNDISDNFWDGINCWLKDSECQMTIEKNHVHDIGFNLLDDIGCIYVTNAKKGVVIQNNYVHKAGCHNYGAWGLYVDLDCHDVVVQNNLAHDFYDGCIHFHYGFNNIAKNNILGFNKIGLMSKGQNEQGTMVTICNNIFITNEGSFYCDLWASNSFNSYSNLYWDFNLNLKMFNDNDGKDNTGKLADPRFTDPLNRVFTFTDESVAKGIGFVPFTYSDCGVVGESWRKVASDYVIPPFPEKSTNDEELLSNEKVYPDYDRVITASQTKSPSQSATQPPTNTPTSTPLDKYSNKEFKGQMKTIYLNEYNQIENSKFIDCTLTDSGNYIIIVQAETHFKNVEFTLSNSKIGAIKIEYDGDVTIENCQFLGCSVSNGNGNAILISQSGINQNNEAISNIIFDNCIFKNCGENGYAFYFSITRNNDQISQLTLLNSIFEYNIGGGAFLCNEIQNNGNAKLVFDKCTFNSNSAKEIGGAICILSASSLLVTECTFKNNACGNEGGAIYIDYSKPTSLMLLESSDSFCTISSCLFDGNKAELYGNAIYINDSRTDISYVIENNNFENNYYKSDDIGYVIVTKSINLDISKNQFSNPNSQIRVNPYMNIQNPPFKTPEPLAVEKVYQNEKGEVDTSSFIKNDTEYLLEVTQEKVTLQGNGNENLFLQIPKDFDSIEITETEAAFGLKLDPDDSNITVKLNQEEAHMNINGGGNLTISTQDNIAFLSIGDITISQKENLHIYTKLLPSFKLGNMKMYGECSFDASVQENNAKTEAKSIKLFEGADSKMSNIKITEKVDIEHGSSITLNNVDISNTEINIEISGSNQSYPTLSGNLCNPPASINLNEQKQENAVLLEEHIVYIASAPENDFTQCEEWKKKVNLEETNFKQVECKAENGYKILYVSSSKNVSPTPKKKSNLLPIIIGVACGAVVIVIIIVVVVVVVKKKKKDATSDVKIENDDAISI